MLAFRSTLLAALVSVAACDQEPDDADRTAEDLDIEAEDDELELEIVDELPEAAPSAPTRTPAPDEDDPDTALPLGADIEPEAMKWECNGDPEAGTYMCCRPYGIYDLPWCCWWNGSAYECS